MSITTELLFLLCLIAAAASAIGGLFAARAASQAADFARVAQQALKASERRASLRDLAITAGSVLVEAKRTNGLIGQILLLRRSMAMAAGNAQSVELESYVADAERRRVFVGTLVQTATPYADSVATANLSSADDIERLHVQQTLALKEIQALHEDLDREHSGVEGERSGLLEQMEKARLSSRY